MAVTGQSGRLARAGGVVLAVVVVAGAAAAPASAAAEPCTPVEDDDLVSLSAPRLLTFARDAAVFVNAYDEDHLASRLEDARLEYRNSYGEVFFSRLLTSRDIADLADDTPLRFPIRAGHGEGPMLVRLSYTQRTRIGFDEGDPERTCEVERESTVRPFAGVPPKPSMAHREPLGNGMAPFAVFLGVPCEQLAPGALQVVVRHHRVKRTWRPRSEPCGTTSLDQFPRWNGQGSILPGLRRNPVVEGFQIVAHRRWTRDYRVDVLWNGKTLLRRWVRIRIVSYEPARRLYENDSEEFYEICLFESSEGDAPPPRRDAEGRRYCVVGPRMFWRGKILKTRP